MNIEIKCHFWPKTPHLREVKLLVDEKLIISSFLTKKEINNLSEQIIDIYKDLINIEETF